MPEANTDRYSRPVVLAALIIGLISLSIKPNRSSRAPNVTAPMISQIVSSSESMPPRDSKRSISATPVLATKPLAIAVQIAWIEPTTGFELPSISRTNALTTSRCRIVACTPANNDDASSASEAGTLRTDSTMSNTNGSRFHGVIQKIWSSLASSTASPTVACTGGPTMPSRVYTTAAITNAGIDVHAWWRMWV